MIHKNAVWHDRKRNCLGLPWFFTVYEFDEDKLYIDTGLINTREDEIRLYRVLDLTLTRSLWQKLIGTGTIHIDSSDPALGNFDLRNIKRARKVKEQLSELVEKARKKGRVFTQEKIDVGGPGMGPGDNPFDAPGDPGYIDPDDHNH